MAQNYIRQSSFADGDTITASLFNNEYNQLVNTFSYSSLDASSTGHRHDGSAGQGGNIYIIGDLDFHNKIEIFDTNKISFYIEDTGAAVEQINIQDGAILPVLTNDIDLGSSLLKFKDLFISGSATIEDATFNTVTATTITLAGADANEGIITWNNQDNTADLQLNSSVTLQIGQEEVAYVTNQSGVTIANGTVVKVTGSSGSKVTVDKASATSESTSASTFAIATQAIDNNQSGYVTMSGFVRGLNTVAFAEGAAIYLSTTSGEFTTTQPASPNHLVHLGWIVRSHSSQGEIFVKINNGWELEELHDVLITSVGDNEILQWNSTSNVWENQTLAEATIATYAGTETLTNKTINADNNTITDIEVDNFKTGVLDTDITSVAGTHTTVPSALAVKTYVDAQVTAQDLDIVGDTGTDSIDLDSETITFAGGTGLTSAVTAGTVTFNIDSTVATLTGTQTLSNKTFSNEITASGGIALPDSQKATFGASDDLEIWHNGLHSYISEVGTGNLRVTTSNFQVRNVADNAAMITAIDGGSTYLYNNGDLKLEATSTGIDVTGEITADGIALDDNQKATFGASDDLQIYHDGSHSYVRDAGTGDLYLGTNGTKLWLGNIGTGEAYAEFNDNGAVSLRYDASTKLATTSTGIDVNGTVTADGLTVVGTTGLTDFNILDDSGTVAEASWSHVDGSGTSTINVGRNSTWGGSLIIQTDTKNRANFASNGDISFYEDTGTTAKFFWDASAERLGLGTTTPATDLHIVNSSAAQFLLQAGASDTCYFLMGDSADTNIGWIAYENATDAMSFRTNNAERMRIDSSGNLLVGRTTTNYGTEGVDLRPDGRVTSTRDGNTSLVLNRLTSDGSIIDFYKDGTTVGSIGTLSGDLTLGTGITGIHFKDDSDAIIPYNVSTGADRNGDIDLGLANNRFKDIYLSGRGVGSITTDNDLSFDMTNGSYFKCTPSSTGTLTFTNITAGQSGNIWLDNSAGVTISAASTTYISAADLAKINTAGVYFVSYYSDGTNVMVSVSSAVTSAGA